MTVFHHIVKFIFKLKNMIDSNYAKIIDRIKATISDSIILIIFTFIISYILSHFENVPENLKMIIFINTFIFYNPLFISFFGGTIGHMMFQICVKRELDTHKNIPFILAILRHITKSFLGIISLFIISSNEKKKAIHDYIAKSVVIYSKK